MKVVVGLSGGVDSSVTALLLKNKGYDVHGVYMSNWDCNKKDYQDVLSIAKKINITVERVSFEADYIDTVFIPFLAGLDKGMNINPDVFCNSIIKFGLLYDYAINKKGADFLATGHYCINKNNNLFRPKDLSKDQSYFLYNINYDCLSNVLFPLGDLNKTEVRIIAEAAGLITSNKKDSTGICFIGNGSFSAFITKYRPNNPGDIVFDGKVVGKHKGLHYYTLGQRKGLRVSGKGPFFVVDKDVGSNQLIIDVKDSGKLWINLINLYDKKGDFNGDCFIRLSNLGELHPANVLGDKIKIGSIIKKVGIGQSVVFYSSKGKILGGGQVLSY